MKSPPFTREEVKLCRPAKEGGERNARHPSGEVKPWIGTTGLVSECQEWPEAAERPDTCKDEREKESNTGRRGRGQKNLNNKQVRMDFTAPQVYKGVWFQLFLYIIKPLSFTVLKKTLFSFPLWQN